MNINTDNFRKQLNSCSRTQDKVAKDSINKGKSLSLISFRENGRTFLYFGGQTVKS